MVSIFELYSLCSYQPLAVTIYNEDDETLLDTWSEKELKKKGFLSPEYSVKSWWMADGNLEIWI